MEGNKSNNLKAYKNRAVGSQVLTVALSSCHLSIMRSWSHQALEQAGTLSPYLCCNQCATKDTISGRNGANPTSTEEAQRS